ncbi:MAG: ABC transporter ATP-binding protein [Alphaproteobacteria bacterium]|nr:ABC transporter ATP-binding protein [Alphaproteobacteria bacterium]
MSEPVLRLEAIRRSYLQGAARLDVLRDVSLEIKSGEIVALLGPSGAGKSTLLHVAGLLERPGAGEVVIQGRACGPLSDPERTAIRRTELGFVYQFHHLLAEFTALENVALPRMIDGASREAAGVRGVELLEAVGLGGRLAHRPSELSGGEQQRVAIARAVANRPAVLLADEPTGNLDHKTADAVFEQIVRLVRETGLAALVATHNLELAKRMDRTLFLREGAIVPG